jgi:hypothetical protein
LIRWLPIRGIMTLVFDAEAAHTQRAQKRPNTDPW